jgi:methylated-DNA-[protein]-cysteine S-methyltransferase
MKPTPVQPPAFCLRDTPFGTIAVLWSVRAGAPGIDRILIPAPDRTVEEKLLTFFSTAVAAACPEIVALAERLEASLNGADVRFPLDALRLDRCPAFQREVLCADHAIPRGRVSTYGLVAGRQWPPRAPPPVGPALAPPPKPHP